MHEGVDEAYEDAVSAGIVLGAAPADHRHHGVVVQVQEGHLVVLLPQHEEDRVQELGHLRQEVDVDPSGHLEVSLRGITMVERGFFFCN